MTFLWADFLWLLVLLPVLVFLYWLVLRRKRKTALRYASLAMAREAMGTVSRVRRHVPPLILLCAVATLILAMARPAAVLTLPARYETIILAIDISGSMRATDVSPDRITAAQTAAKAFVERQASTTRIGVVAYATDASLVQPPTQNRQDIVAAIERLQPQRATAIGSGILVSLKAIFPDMEIDLGAQRRNSGRGPLREQQPPSPTPVAPGSYGSAVVVLLTDGQNTSGPDPIDAAKIAADRGVRVYTVGIGTEHGEVVIADGYSLRVRLDEETLKRVAEITRSEYFYAGSGTELQRIYDVLTSRFVMERKESEVTAMFTTAGTLLVVLSALLSLFWFNRIL